MFKITSIGGNPNSYSQKEYLLTDISDIDKLPKCGIRGTLNDPNDSVADEPCAYGSTAMVCTGSLTEVYILTPNNEWVKM